MLNSPTTNGKLIILVAPSGSGKTTIAKKLLCNFQKIRFSVSATTRAPRKNEKDGKDYFFLSKNEFDQKIKEGDFLEWECYSGHQYGTLRYEVDKLMKKGYFPLLDIEVKGALNVKKIYGERCMSIFIQPPSLEELRQRLLERGSETDQSLKKRLKRAEEELSYVDYFDCAVINNNLQTAYKQVKTIIESFISDL